MTKDNDIYIYGIMTCGLIDSDFTNDEFRGHYAT